MGVVVVSRASIAVVTAVAAVHAVEVPEVAERPPHGGAAEDLHDGGDVACRSWSRSGRASATTASAAARRSLDGVEPGPSTFR